MTVFSEERPAVIGAGVMGQGIAYTFARAGLRCGLIDRSTELAEEGVEEIARLARSHEARGILPSGGAEEIASNVHFGSLEGVLPDVTFAVEVVTEDPAVKAVVHAEIERNVSPDAVIASNTSAIPITEMAESLELPERFLGTHWFLPAPLVPCVEIVPGEKTDPATVKAVQELHRRIGKRAVVVSDSAGFVGNRLQFALFAEAARIAAEGQVSPEQIDEVVRSSFGFRLPFYGPFAIADMAGLDVYGGAYDAMHAGLGERFARPGIIDESLSRNRLGVKSGGGLRDWTDDEIAKALDERDSRYAALRDLMESRDGDQPA